jgi:hypothetical protein
VRRSGASHELKIREVGRDRRVSHKTGRRIPRPPGSGSAITLGRLTYGYAGACAAGRPEGLAAAPSMSASLAT